MFEKSKTSPPSRDSSLPVSTMPVEFYAGTNPIVKFKTVEKEVDLTRKAPLISKAEKAALDKATAAGRGRPWHPANLLTNRRFLLWSGIILFVISTTGISWYYWRQALGGRPTTAPPPPSPTVTKPIQPSSPAPVVVPEVVPPTTTISVPVTLPPALLEFPSLLLGDSLDSDKDGLTDADEVVFSTDSSNLDTDADGYMDSLEVENLYSPIDKAPVRLIDSAGLVKDFTNPVFGYKVYYPAGWALGNVDQDYRQVLFSTLTGENIEIRVFDREPNESFADWFAKQATDQKFADLADFSSKFKEQGLKRKDDLVYYFSDPNRIYVILYHTTDSNIINYRMILKMMAASFRLGSNTFTLPVQAIEGAENIVTSSSASPAL